MSFCCIALRLGVALLFSAAATAPQARVVITDSANNAGSTIDLPAAPEAIQALPSPADQSSFKPKSAVIAPKRVSPQIQHGLRLLHGLAGPQDIKQAGYTFMLAYARGDAQASAAVAYCTLLGCYGVPDVRSVALWIERARVRESGKAKLLEWAAAEQFNANASSARLASLLREAATLQDPVALNEQGLQQLTASQRAAALKSFETAAQRGSPAATRNFKLLIQQPGNQADTPERTSASSPGQSFYEQAKRYHLGQGVPLNDVQAIELYRQAANQGHLQAKRMLELIFSRANAQGQPDPTWMRLLAQRQTGVNSLGTQATAIWPLRDISLLADWLPVE